MVSQVPSTSTASRSRPWLSEPNGVSQEGGWLGMAESGSERLVSITSRPIPANSSNKTSIATPLTKGRLRPRYPIRGRRQARRTGITWSLMVGRRTRIE